MIHVTYSDCSEEYGILTIHVVGSGIFRPNDLKAIHLPASINTRKGIVISGRAPIWLYAHLTTLCSTCVWVATYDPRIGAVVVHSCDTSESPLAPGDVVDVPASVVHEAANVDSIPRVADEQQTYHIGRKTVAVVGDPQSGKTVLLHAMHRGLKELLGLDAYRRDVFTVRASPDGDGEWMTELPTEEAMLVRFKGKWDDEFADSIVEHIARAENGKSLILVDCGGKIDKRNQHILNACSHAIIVAREDNVESISRWKGALECCDVQPISVLVTSVTAEINTNSSARNDTNSGLSFCHISNVKRETAASVSIPQHFLQELLQSKNS